jgi:hypothetical protein
VNAGKGDRSGFDRGFFLRTAAEISVMTSPIVKGYTYREAALVFKERHHIRGGQRDSARVNSGCIEEGSGDCRRAHGIGAFRAAAEPFVVA